jgi:hypothetical protein
MVASVAAFGQRHERAHHSAWIGARALPAARARSWCEDCDGRRGSLGMRPFFLTELARTGTRNRWRGPGRWENGPRGS